jgi:hypothetical protein
MILSEILQVKRVDGFFIVDDVRIKADRIASDGYGVLVVFEPSKLDYDFKEVIGPNRFAWFPSVESLDLIHKELDLSDHLTLDLHNGVGWGGKRPFKIEEFV